MELTRRQILAAGGVTIAGSTGAVYYRLNTPIEASGGSESGTICTGTAQTPPNKTLNILGVRVNKTTVSVGYNIVSDRPVDSVVVSVDGEQIAKQSWTGENADFTFPHDTPTEFKLQALSKEGRVLDSAELSARCGPAEELTS